MKEEILKRQFADREKESDKEKNSEKKKKLE